MKIRPFYSTFNKPEDVKHLLDLSARSIHFLDCFLYKKESYRTNPELAHIANNPRNFKTVRECLKELNELVYQLEQVESK